MPTRAYLTYRVVLAVTIPVSQATADNQAKRDEVTASLFNLDVGLADVDLAVSVEDVECTS